MEKKYIAKETKSFSGNENFPDIVKGNTYDADRDKEYFISEFGELVFIPKKEFFSCFKSILSETQKDSKKSYRQKQTTMIYITLFPQDQDIIDHLNKIVVASNDKRRGGKSEYIRGLIRKDIAENKI